jgi:ApbE superfamily uncharacterized protein (UPF0280 family)
MNPMQWEPRTYRLSMDAAGLVSFTCAQGETDLHVSAGVELRGETEALVAALRADLERYIAAHPRWAESYVPVDAEEGAPEIVRAMSAAARQAGTGPMAAVAGAIAERVACGLQTYSREVIVENGGDLYLCGGTSRRVLVVAGDSPLSGKMTVRLDSADLPVAVCTSSGKVGHSVSLGTAHAVTVVAEDGALADAVATAAGNVVHGSGDVERALERAMSVRGVRGAVVIAGDRAGFRGNVNVGPAES